MGSPVNGVGPTAAIADTDLVNSRLVGSINVAIELPAKYRTSNERENTVRITARQNNSTDITMKPA